MAIQMELRHFSKFLARLSIPFFCLLVHGVTSLDFALLCYGSAKLLFSSLLKLTF